VLVLSLINCPLSISLSQPEIFLQFEPPLFQVEPATFTQWVGQHLASSTDAREVARVLLEQGRPGAMTWAAYLEHLGWEDQ
jgi:hypothetical protein